MNLGSFKNLINNVFTNHIYSIFMNKEDLALNNLQWLICHKTKPNNIYECKILFEEKNYDRLFRKS